jgi:hypothetical protein
MLAELTLATAWIRAISVSWVRSRANSGSRVRATIMARIRGVKCSISVPSASRSPWASRYARFAWSMDSGSEGIDELSDSCSGLLSNITAFPSRLPTGAHLEKAGLRRARRDAGRSGEAVVLVE